MIYILILSIERLFAPWMFTYQIIIMLETSTLLTVDKNEQTLVERLNKYLQDITTLSVQQIISMFPKDVRFIFIAITVGPQ